jgi:ADP-heptose:LPS heptosyltransferase
LKRIIISRTDSIGDVVLTLPVTGFLKETFPDCEIIFLGRAYTRPVIEACRFVDRFIDLAEISGSGPQEILAQNLAGLNADVIIHVFPVKEICKASKKAGIPIRIATSHRLFTWFSCNRLIHYSRKNSPLHEAQLNLKLLEPLGIKRQFSLEEIPRYYGLQGVEQAKQTDRKFRLILHPKSKGSAREWGLENFGRLIDLLPASRFHIMITGTKEEGELMKDFLKRYRGRVTDLTGKMTLPQLFDLIAQSDALVAASTGPLHIAAALGKRATGLYAPMRPIFPQRWAPLGQNATYLVLEKNCDDCRHTGDCLCIRSITPEMVVEKLG